MSLTKLTQFDQTMRFGVFDKKTESCADTFSMVDSIITKVAECIALSMTKVT